MYSYGSRILSLFLDPAALTLFLILCAWAIRKRWSKTHLGLLATAVILLIALGCPTTSNWLVRSLENQYPDKGIAGAPAAQAIVVLGGSLNMPSELHPSSGITNSSDRMLMALRLYRAGKASLLVLSGGDSPLLEKSRKKHEADEMRDLLEEWGVPASAILDENGSINTHENALFTHQLLQQRGIERILLVTSALHMPRAAATFRKVGFDVSAIPADFRTGWEKEIPISDWIPASGASENSREALHEWLGLWVYRVRGWT